jgi:hypothetical protein
MIALNNYWQGSQAIQRIVKAMGSELAGLQRFISESSAEIARNRMASYVALKAGTARSIFAAGDRVSYIRHGVVIETDGRVLDQTRHGVVVEFDKIGQLLVSPESLSLVKRPATGRHSVLPRRKPASLNRFRRKLI